MDTEQHSSDQLKPEEKKAAPKSGPLIVASLHTYEDVALTTRCLDSLVESLKRNHPDCNVVISVVDDTRTAEGRNEISHAAQSTAKSLVEISPNYQIEYLTAQDNQFMQRTVDMAQTHGISETMVKLLTSADISAGYVGYTGSINQGELRAMYLAGKMGIPPEQAMVAHIDQDEISKSYDNLPDQQDRVSAGERDFFGDRLQALIKGYEVAGAKYSVHSGSPSTMLLNLTSYIQRGLEMYVQNPEDLDRQVPFPISVSEDGINYVTHTPTLRDFFNDIDSIINSSTHRTPVIGIKTEQDFIDRDRSLDSVEAPVSRTIRLDTASKLFDPHNRGMHEIIWYFGTRALTDDDTKITRLPPHIHHRSPKFGNDLQGKDILDAINPQAVAYTYGLLEISDDELASQFSTDEMKILHSVKKNLGHSIAVKVLHKLHQVEKNVEGIDELLKLVPVNPDVDSGITSIRSIMSKFSKAIPEARQELIKPIDKKQLIKDIKRYFRYRKVWSKLCTLAYEQGSRDKDIKDINAEAAKYLADHRYSGDDLEKDALQVSQDNESTVVIKPVGVARDTNGHTRDDLPYRGMIISEIINLLSPTPLVPREHVRSENEGGQLVVAQELFPHRQLKDLLISKTPISFSSEAMTDLYSLTALSILLHMPDLGEHNIGLRGETISGRFVARRIVIVDLDESFVGDRDGQGVIQTVGPGEIISGLRPSSKNPGLVSAHGLFNPVSFLAYDFGLKLDPDRLRQTYYSLAKQITRHQNEISALIANNSLMDAQGDPINEAIREQLQTRTNTLWLEDVLQTSVNVSIDGVRITGTDSLDQAYNIGLAYRRIVGPQGQINASKVIWTRENNTSETPLSFDRSEIQQESFTFDSAIKANQLGTLRSWVVDYLRAGGANVKLARTIEAAEYVWVDLVEFPLDQLKRVMGPEEEMPFRESKADWEKRVTSFIESIKAGYQPPPLIVTDSWGEREIADGTHRFEALRRLGYNKYWTACFAKTEESKQAIVSKL